MKMNISAAFVGDAFGWWFHELQSALGSFLPKRKPAQGPYIDISPKQIRVINSAGVQSLVVQTRPDDVTAALMQNISAPSGSYDLVLREGTFLTRQLAPRRLPDRQARPMAEIDLLAATPLDPASVYIAFVEDNGTGSSYHVIRKKTLAPVVKAIQENGGTIKSLSIANGDVIRGVDRLSLLEIVPLTLRERVLGRIWKCAFAGLCSLVVALYGQTYWRYHKASVRLDEQIEAAQTEAKVASALLKKQQAEAAQIAYIRKEKTASPLFVQIWAELTHLMPDTTWLTDLSSEGGEITITGFSTSAAALIEPLEASSLFTTPEFVAPVVKVPGQEGERFIIRAKVRQP